MLYIRLIQLPLGVLVLVSQFRMLGVDEFNICGSVHHALFWLLPLIRILTYFTTITRHLLSGHDPSFQIPSSSLFTYIIRNPIV